MVFNKIDAYKPDVIDQDDLVTVRTEVHYTLEDWKNTWMNRVNGDAVFISALNKENLEEFKQTLYNKVKDIHVARFPYNSFLFTDYSQYTEDE